MKLLNKKIQYAVIVVTLLFGTSCFAQSFVNASKIEYNKGVDYFNANQYPQAIECFKRATELDPNYIDAYYNLGSLLEHLNQDENALLAFKQIILRKPDDYEAVYKAAEISDRLGFFDKAKMYLTLIPADSIVGQKAAALSNSIDSKLSQTEEKVQQTVQTAQQAVQTAQTDEPIVNNSAHNSEPAKNLIVSNGVYQDIASPTGVTADNEGNLYVAGFSDNTIYKITPDNDKIVYIKDSKIDGPIGLAIDRNQNIYIANYNRNNVIKVEKNGRISELITDIKQPYCMYVSGNLLFVSSQGSNSVIRYKLD